MSKNLRPKISRIPFLCLTFVLWGCSASNDEFNENWILWLEENNNEIRSLESEVFVDLQFLNQTLEDKRIVQLGESGHGVAEFNKAKVRLIKFLHEEMDFDVIAFESSIFECYISNEAENSLSARDLMTNSIFGVWYTEEVLELFDYIKSTKQTESPLILAGVDVQSSSTGRSRRPGFLHDVVNSVDPFYADQVFTYDADLIDIQDSGYTLFKNYVTENEDDIVAYYDSFINFIDEHRAQLEAAFIDDPLTVPMAEQTVWSIIQNIHQTATRDNDRLSSRIFRDRGMAFNLDFIADVAYPDKKIMLWAHNFHIRHDNESTVSVNGFETEPTMGKWIAQSRRDELYTIGLLMNKGEAAFNNRQNYDIIPAVGTSVEAILKTARLEYLFIDLLNQQYLPGNSWMFDERINREWGLFDQKMIIRDQYDGILYINEVSPPQYLTN